jgi:hypothetical protein
MRQARLQSTYSAPSALNNLLSFLPGAWPQAITFRVHFAPFALILICSLFVVNSDVSNSLALGIGRGSGNCAALAVGRNNDSPTDRYLAVLLAG